MYLQDTYPPCPCICHTHIVFQHLPSTYQLSRGRADSDVISISAPALPSVSMMERGTSGSLRIKFNQAQPMAYLRHRDQQGGCGNGKTHPSPMARHESATRRLRNVFPFPPSSGF
ncbi:hypothetical protein PAXRUDRAFT_823285 [Paxillus rubicundulus Ve08.2h10]|uniref:Uncharacterized protein n=1 Tax=Paxillus rubicundulus Ve08.2h10 TaxID=930991 RepID=A0A0D0E8Z3_9AGAM|nr:hypothetical protein PAXRUDRAFT_823285 [Paxillus rubicundulus Ve08.2h10]